MKRSGSAARLFRLLRPKVWADAVSLERLVLRRALSEKAKKQRVEQALSKHAGTAERLNRVRAKRQVVQRFRAKLTRTPGWRVRVEPAVLARRYRANAILDSLYPGRKAAWKPILTRDRVNAYKLTIERFSFFEDPDGALETIAELAKAECNFLEARIDFLFECEDMGPILVLAEAWPAFLPIFSGGKMTPTLQKVVEATDLSRALRMKFPGLTDLRNVLAVPVRRRRARGTTESKTRYLDAQTSEDVQDSICDLIDKWFLACGASCELNAEGRARLSSLVGEILDNAERHSSYADKDGSWSVGGFMVRTIENGAPKFRCHLAFVSVGDTIASSLAATASSRLRNQLDALFLRLRRVARAPQSEATLYTLAALQDGVTRDDVADAEERGGTGLLDVVEFVNELGATWGEAPDAEVVVISGGSCIRMRTPYVRGLRDEPADPRRLWFNAENSTEHAPSADHVFDLRHRFPGTVISLAYTLDPEFLRSSVGG